MLKNKNLEYTAQSITDNQKIFLQFVSKALKDKEIIVKEPIDWCGMEIESIYQSVSLLLFHYISADIPEEVLRLWKRQAYGLDICFNKINYENKLVDKLMNENNIPYVVMKGIASARYYIKPNLREMGDIDIFVRSSDLEKAKQVIKDIGFRSDHEEGTHICYFKEPSSIWELHIAVNGIPNNDNGKKIKDYLSDMIETAVDYNGVMVPDDFHHGLVLLIHTAGHLTSSGIGIRHLCDWAVFYSSFKEEDFLNLFEEKLKNVGLWDFAKILTQLSIKYLNTKEMKWVGKFDDKYLETLMADILKGGNFGQKDQDRTRQIKYFNDSKNHIVNNKGPIRQAYDSLKYKAENENKSKVRVLLDYIKKVRTHERELDSRQTINEAVKRKQLYKNFNLYE